MPTYWSSSDCSVVTAGVVVLSGSVITANVIADMLVPGTVSRTFHGVSPLILT